MNKLGKLYIAWNQRYMNLVLHDKNEVVYRLTVIKKRRNKEKNISKLPMLDNIWHGIMNRFFPYIYRL